MSSLFDLEWPRESDKLIISTGAWHGRVSYHAYATYSMQSDSVSTVSKRQAVTPWVSQTPAWPEWLAGSDKLGLSDGPGHPVSDECRLQTFSGLALKGLANKTSVARPELDLSLTEYLTMQIPV